MSDSATTDWDLIIVGGGPVGLVTAIAARQRGLSAVVVERSVGLPEKACGEGLMPGAMAVLDALGVELACGFEFQGIRFVDTGAVAAARFTGRKGRGVSRTSLMEALVERARIDGVSILAGHTLRDFSYRERVLSARLSAAGGRGSVTLRGRLLVAADGLRSGVRRQLGHELPGRRPQRFGLQRHYPCAPWTDWVEVYWDDAAEAYVTPLSATQVGVALLSHGAPSSFEVMLARFPSLQRALARGGPPGRVRGAGPFEQRVSDVLAPGVALVGDAAGYLDAISGEGLALGFRSASSLVERFASGQLWRYPGDHARLCASHHALTHVMLQIARRPRLRRTVIGFLAARPALFSDLLAAASDASGAPRSPVAATLSWALPFLGLAQPSNDA
jgi:flavin-dependent dehydrogenase